MTGLRTLAARRPSRHPAPTISPFRDANHGSIILLLRTSSIPALAVLHSRDFRLLWTARWIHEVARRMEILVLGYLVFQLTDSPFQVGLIAVCLNAPRPALSLYGGLLADRLDRQRILLGVHTTYLALATVILVLLMADAIQPWHAFIAMLLQGSAKAWDDPARRTAIFDLAGPNRLAHAMSLETITNNVGKILGPIAGGVLIATTGFMGAYGVLVALDLAALLLMVRLRLPDRAPARRSDLALWPGLREAMAHALTNRMVLGVLSTSLIMNALVFPIQYFIPVIASDLLLVGTILGGLLGSAEGIGTLIGATLIAVRRNIRHHGRLFIAGALSVTVAVALVAWSPWFALSFTLLLLGGMGQAGFSTMQSTILLLASQPHMRGRVMGVQGMVNGLGHLFGDSAMGAMASAFGISLAIGLSAGVGLLLIVPVMIFTPLVWRPIARGI